MTLRAQRLRWRGRSDVAFGLCRWGTAAGTRLDAKIVTSRTGLVFRRMTNCRGGQNALGLEPVGMIHGVCSSTTSMKVLAAVANFARYDARKRLSSIGQIGKIGFVLPITTTDCARSFLAGAFVIAPPAPRNVRTMVLFAQENACSRSTCL